MILTSVHEVATCRMHSNKKTNAVSNGNELIFYNSRRRTKHYSSSDHSHSLLKLKRFHLFPCEIRIVASKVTIGSSLSHAGALQVEVTNDASGAKIKVLLDNFGKIGIRHAFLDSSIGIDKDGKRVGNSNGIRELHKATTAKATSMQQ